MFYFAVFLILKAAPFIHGDYQGRTTLIKNEYDNLGIIAVGQNKQSMATLFDTGSNHMWVVSDEKPFGEVKQGTEEPNLPFKVSASTTFFNTEVKYEEPYPHGKIFGYRAKDNVIITSTPDGVDLGRIEFGVVERITAVIKSNIFNLNGVMFGLNLVSPELIPNELTPSLEFFVKKSPVFGFYNKYGDRYLVYGQPDNDLISGPFTTHDVVKIDHYYNGWNLKISKIQVEKLKAKRVYTPKDVLYGKVSTGSYFVLLGPKTLFKQIVEYIYSLGSIKKFDADQVYSFKCDYRTYEQLLDKLPVVSVFINGVKMDIEPKYYFVRLEAKELCYSMVGAADVDHVKIGNGFIAKYYTQFDYNKKQISFALAKEPPKWR